MTQHGGKIHIVKPFSNDRVQQVQKRKNNGKKTGKVQLGAVPDFIESTCLHALTMLNPIISKSL